MVSLTLRFEGEPVPKRAPFMRFMKGRIVSYPNKRNVEAKAAIVKQLREQLPAGFKVLARPLRARVFFVRAAIKKPKSRHAMTRPDLDNYLKQIWDALNGIVFIDDAQIVCVEAAKVYGKPGEPGYIHLELEDVEDEAELMLERD